ncbi:hypothetical protein AMTRI_Chr03g144490 [Amborella trichopoda]
MKICIMEQFSCEEKGKHLGRASRHSLGLGGLTALSQWLPRHSLSTPCVLSHTPHFQASYIFLRYPFASFFLLQHGVEKRGDLVSQTFRFCPKSNPLQEGKA